MMGPQELPETIGGRYQVEAELGRGMMGVVYKAHDPVMDRTVALKVVRLAFPVTPAKREEFEKRFLSEARIVARLSHPNIVVAFDVGRDEAEGNPYMALEYLVGRTLAAVLEEGPALDWRESLRITSRVAEALHYAHEQGVVHRDIKPANIMILGSGEPKIMDFGLAKQRAGLDLTSSGQFMGTPMFMAPEQAAGGEVDGRTDLFSLGAVAYTMVTGTKAFDGENILQILNRVTQEDPPRASRVNKELPETLDDVLKRTLAKEPERRYPDGRSLAEDLQDVLEGRSPRHMTGWRPAPTAERTMFASGRVEAADLPELEITPDAGEVRTPAAVRDPPARRGRGLFLLLLGALGVALYLSPDSQERLVEAGRAVQAHLPPEWQLPDVLLPRPATTPTPTSTPEARDARATPTPTAHAGGESATLPGAAEEETPGVADPRADEEASDVDIEPGSEIEGGDVETGETDVGTGSPAATLAPRAGPAGTASRQPSSDESSTAPTPASKTSPRATARLKVSVDHDVARGRIRVLVDNRVKIRRTLRGTSSRRFLLLSRTRGHLDSEVRVPVGRHKIVIEVRSKAGRFYKTLPARFRSRHTHPLHIEVSNGGRKIETSWRQ